MGEIECKVALVAGFAMMGAASPGLAAPAARVEFAVGNAEVFSAGGQPRALQKGAPIGEAFLVTNRQSEPALTDKQVDLPPVQPGDPVGGAFQTANDSTKNPGSSPLIAGDQTTPSGAPVGLILIGQQTLDGVQGGFGSAAPLQSFVAQTVVLNTAGVVVQLPDATSAQLLGAAGFGNDGISAWGAFKDTSGAVVHYAVGLPVDITPKTATYALALPQMATRPTDAQGNVVGSLLSWNQAVDFINKWGTASAAWEVQGVQLDAQLSGPFDVGMSGQCAATSCFVNARGLPVGPRAQGFMVAYLLNYFPSPTRESPKPVDISARGTAVLTQTSAQ